MTRPLLLCALASCALLACQAKEPVTTTSTAPVTPPQAASTTAATQSTPRVEAVTPSEATPEDFSKAWAALKAESDPNTQLRTQAELRATWLGHSYTWQGVLMAGLCIESMRTCSINVFRHQDNPLALATGGFFPKITFSPQGWQAIKDACAKKSECMVTFEAPLKEFQAELGLPLIMRFDEASVTLARERKKGEFWMAMRSRDDIPSHVKDAKRPKLRTGTPSHIDLSKLKTATF